MKCLIRIRGKVGIDKDMEETLDRLRLMKKYSCVVLNPSKESAGMIKKVRNFIAFGDIDNETFKELLEKRGQAIDKKEKNDVAKAIEAVSKGKKFEEFNLKPFFRLHPPRKGIKTKLHFPQGVLGDHKDKINELVRRML